MECCGRRAKVILGAREGGALLTSEELHSAPFDADVPEPARLSLLERGPQLEEHPQAREHIGTC